MATAVISALVGALAERGKSGLRGLETICDLFDRYREDWIPFGTDSDVHGNPPASQSMNALQLDLVERDIVRAEAAERISQVISRIRRPLSKA